MTKNYKGTIDKMNMGQLASLLGMLGSRKSGLAGMGLVPGMNIGKNSIKMPTGHGWKPGQTASLSDGSKLVMAGPGAGNIMKGGQVIGKTAIIK